MTTQRAIGTSIAEQAGFVAARRTDCIGFRTGRKVAAGPRQTRYGDVIV